MTIQDYAAIGEIVGGIAVIVTLLYLAAQIRQTNKAILSSSFHEISNSYIHVNGWITSDESLARIFRIGLEKPEDLTEDEFVRFSVLLLSLFRVIETIYFQREVGTVDPRLWAGEIRTTNEILSSPGGRKWWATNPFGFTAEFREYVDREISRHESERGSTA